jgi:hypothetical protein
MTTIEDLERIKPLFKDNIYLYNSLLMQVLNYDELMTLDLLNINYTVLSLYVSKEDFYNNMDNPWDLTIIVQNKNFKIEDILTDSIFNNYRHILIHNPSITLQQLIDNDLLIDELIPLIGYNPNITLQEFIKYKNGISYCTYINFSEEIIDYVLENSLYDDIYLISESNGLTYRLYLKYKNLFTYSIQVYRTIELKDIAEFSKECPIYYKNLSRNKNLTIDYLMENMNKPWDTVWLSFGYFIKEKPQSHLQLQFVD